MEGSSDRKFILIKRKTRLDELISRFNSASQAKFYVEHLGADFSDYELEHREYISAISNTADSLSKFGRVHILDRAFLPNFIFGQDDIIIAIGQDGMVANTLKYLTSQPLLGLNPSPKRWDGVLLPFHVQDIPTIIPEVLKGIRKHNEVTIACATLNDGQKLLGVNDLFIGRKTHISAQYKLTSGEYSENQSSSGIIISTGLGSSGWLKSVLAGAKKVVTTISGIETEINSNNQVRWDSDYLYYSVREPFPSNMTGTNLVFGKITNNKPLKIISQMSENGVIFSDGIESDFLEFNSGIEAKIGISENKGILIV